MGEGVLLRPKKSFTETTIDDVAGFFNYSSKAKSLKEMDAAIQKGAKEFLRDID